MSAIHERSRSRTGRWLMSTTTTRSPTWCAVGCNRPEGGSPPKRLLAGGAGGGYAESARHFHRLVAGAKVDYRCYGRSCDHAEPAHSVFLAMDHGTWRAGRLARCWC